MGDLLTSSEQRKSAMESVADWYESNVLLRVGAIACAPPTHGITAILDVGILSTFAFLRRSRLRAFMSE